MYMEIIKKTNELIRKLISEDDLEYMQDILIQLKIYHQITDILTYILLVTLIVFLLLFLISLIFGVSVFIVLLSTLPVMLFINYLVYKKQKRLDSIEEDLPDYLLQVASLLNAGMALESSFDEISKNMDGYLNDEIKRALIEIRMGKTFNDAFMDIADRCDSYNLNKAIQIIINTKQSGGNLSEILMVMADDIKQTQLLKRNKKTSVMMSVMFLLVSAIIATPFSFATIQIYTIFLESVGRTNSLIDVIPIASNGYIIIHSLLVSILIAVVMESNYKKCIKWIVIILPSSMAVFYFSKMLIGTILGI
ncbi:MAG: type II secretion system F family protein [Methanosphaera sp.]|nr:type II secretion system F family protein [Methanosphaera sp.]